jgi:hypothetical protein
MALRLGKLEEKRVGRDQWGKISRALRLGEPEGEGVTVRMAVGDRMIPGVSGREGLRSMGSRRPKGGMAVMWDTLSS